MKILKLCLVVIICSIAKAEPVEVKELSFEVAKFSKYRNSYFLIKDEEEFRYRDDFTYRFGLNWEIVFADDRIYWQNLLHAASAPSSIKYGGWETEFGVRLFPHIDVFAYHHSEHMMEEINLLSLKHPDENSIGFRINFIDSSPQERTSFIKY